jgi:hypothetical protein
MATSPKKTYNFNPTKIGSDALAVRRDSSDPRRAAFIGREHCI